MTDLRGGRETLHGVCKKFDLAIGELDGVGHGGVQWSQMDVSFCRDGCDG